MQKTLSAELRKVTKDKIRFEITKENLETLLKIYLVVKILRILMIWNI